MHYGMASAGPLQSQVFFLYLRRLFSSPT
jgi:hypothetical protein